MKNWIFDLDGTLVDSYPSYAEAVLDGFAHFDVAIKQEELTHLRHLILPKLIEKHLDQKHHKFAKEMIMDLVIKKQTGIKLFEGIDDTLEFLNSKGVHLSIFTARDLKSATGVIKETKLDQFFKRCISRECIPNGKPAPDGIHAILSATKAHITETVMIGDHAMDLKAARSAQVKAIGVSWNVADEELESLSDHHFAKVEDFKLWSQKHFT